MNVIESMRQKAHTSLFVRYGSEQDVANLIGAVETVMNAPQPFEGAWGTVSHGADRTLATVRKDGACFEYDSARGWMVVRNAKAAIELGSGRLLDALAAYCAARR